MPVVIIDYCKKWIIISKTIMTWVFWSLSLRILRSICRTRPLLPDASRRSQQTNATYGPVTAWSVIGGVHCWQQSADNRRITIGRWSLTNTLSEEPAVHAEHARTPSHTLLHYVYKIMTPYHTHRRLKRKKIALDTFVPAISSLVKHRFLFYVICPYKFHTTTVLSDVTTLTNIF